MQVVIEAYLAAKTDDNTTAWVHRKIIYPQFHISIATLYSYLNTPVKKLLKELDAKENEK